MIKSICSVAIGVLLFSTFATASHAGLVAHWPLDIDPLDARGNGHNGAVVGGTVNFGQPGANANTGTSAAFPNNGHIDVPYSAALNPGIKAPNGSGSFTIALWANSSNNGGYNSPFTAREDSGTVNGPIIYNNPSGNWSYWAGNNGGGGAWNPLNDGAVPLNTWQHVAVTYDAGTVTRKMFIDGNEVLSANLGVSANVLRNTHIGSGQDNGANFYWNGLIDDVGFWDEALDETQIQAVRDLGVAGFAGPPPPPPAEATIIKPVSVTTSIAGDAGSSHLYLLDDNTGFTPAALQRPVGTGVTLPTGETVANALDTVHERSGSAHAESWTRPTGFGEPVFSFDLGADTEMDSIILWQYGNSSPGNSTRDFELIFHTEAEGGTFSFASDGGTEATEFTGTMSNAAPYTTAANLAQQFTFGSPESARYVGLRIANNYLGIVSPGGDRYGLGEVRFVAPAADTVIPEPTTFLIWSLGLLGLACYRRRRAK